MKSLFLLVPLCAASVAATADSIATGPKPHESILTSVRAVRNNDLGAVLQAVLTDDQLAEMEAEWNQQRKQPVDPQESAQFQMVMTMLTAPGAEDMLMAQVEPKLAEMRPQVAMMVGMFSGLLQASLEQDQTLQPAEKDRAAKALVSHRNEFATLSAEPSTGREVELLVSPAATHQIPPSTWMLWAFT